MDLPGLYETKINGLSDLAMYDDWLPNGFTNSDKMLDW